MGLLIRIGIFSQNNLLIQFQLHPTFYQIEISTIKTKSLTYPVPNLYKYSPVPYLW